MYGREDLGFLERVFQKLLINFTWWVNRKDSGGNNVFEGGFLGLDNIGIFNRSEPLPTGKFLDHVEQIFLILPVQAALCDKPMELPGWLSML